MSEEAAGQSHLGTPGWRKSSYSTATGACVEIEDRGASIAFRDSKDPSGPELVFSRAQFSLFVQFAATGDSGHAQTGTGQLA